MIHTLGTKHEWTVEHYNNFKMFKTDVLYLGHQDHNGHNYASWNKLIIKIHEFVISNGIKLILLDCTHDPYILDDDKDTRYGPNKITQHEHLSCICKTIIVTEDWNHYYNPQPNILFFAYNLWIQSTRNLDAYYVNQISGYDTTIDKTKPLMCLNRNLHWHRLYMLPMVYNAPWLPLVDFSFILPMKDISNENITQHLTQDELSQIEKISTPIYLDYEGDKEIRAGYSNGASNVNTPVYSRCAVNLVTETSVNQGVVLTEKTAKAFIAYQIPVLITNAGANQFLEDIGIDMFSDYVPWKDWDNIEDSRSRIDKIIEFINSIMQDPNAIMEKHKELHPRLIKNKECFHSIDFAEKLLGPDI